MRRRRGAGIALAVMVAATGAAAADKPTRFWNLTTDTITQLSLAPAGTARWGRNQCENDRDGEVEPRERLRITDVDPGRYDLRIAHKSGRVCIAKAVEVRAGEVFAIEEKDLTDCTP